MGYDQYASSRDEAAPFEAFKFTYGPGEGDVHAFTSAAKPITVAGLQYLPEAIDRTEVSQSGTADKTQVTITVPANNPVAALYKTHAPPQKVLVQIYEGEWGDETREVVSVFTGLVLGCNTAGGQAELTCESATASMQRTGLRRHYQHGCPHVLYGAHCKASRAVATRTTTVSAIDGAQITLPGGWAAGTAEAKFLNGYVEWTNGDGLLERAAILSVGDATTLTLERRPSTLSAGDSLDVVLGCNHQMDDCQTLHSNIQNFGGQPFIPLDNPIGFKSNFY